MPKFVLAFSFSFSFFYARITFDGLEAGSRLEEKADDGLGSNGQALQSLDRQPFRFLRLNIENIFVTVLNKTISNLSPFSRNYDIQNWQTKITPLFAPTLFWPPSRLAPFPGFPTGNRPGSERGVQKTQHEA